MKRARTSKQRAPGTYLGRALVLCTSEVLLTISALIVLYVGWQLGWQDLQAGREQARAAHALSGQWASTPVARQKAVSSSGARQPRLGHAFAIIHVPRFGDDWAPRPIIEGVAATQLDHGVGHYPGTALPGQTGNFSVAGHRVTFGRPFNQITELRPGDPIVVETADGWAIYGVTGSRIVLPTETEVTAAVPGHPGIEPTRAMMTLTACHPMFSARERYVVHAQLVRTQPRSAGRPIELKE